MGATSLEHTTPASDPWPLHAGTNTLAVRQCEEEVIRANTATISMQSTAMWWHALDDGEQIKRSNAFKCVSSIEEVIAAQAVGALTRSSDKDDEQKESGDGGADSKEKKKNA